MFDVGSHDMSLNDWKEDGQPKQMGDQEKTFKRRHICRIPTGCWFVGSQAKRRCENEVEVVAEAVEIQEVVEHPEMPSEKNEKKAKRKKDKAKKKKK